MRAVPNSRWTSPVARDLEAHSTTATRATYNTRKVASSTLVPPSTQAPSSRLGSCGWKATCHAIAEGAVIAARILIIIPTLGERPSYLANTVQSIREQSVPADIVLVSPPGKAEVIALAEKAGARVIADPGNLPGAINAGAALATSDHVYLNWLGDDDLLTSGSLERTVAALDARPDAVLAYGACQYIADDGRHLWVSRAGPWAERILVWGPDLIPQPGMLVRADAWRAVGGLDESFRFAFDLDLLLKLRRQGAFVSLPHVVSCFRWHADSLTVSDRTGSLDESEIARRRYLGPVARRLAWAWEGPVRLATRTAAWEVRRRALRRSEVS